MATLEVADTVPNADPTDFLGVDMGIVNIATTSDGGNYVGAGLRHYRRRMAEVRAELQAKAAKSAKRKLKARARREAPLCGHTAKANRPTRDHFACVGCGLAGAADQVAAVNVRDRARTTWAFVNTPDVADTPQPAADTSDKPPASASGS